MPAVNNSVSPQITLPTHLQQAQLRQKVSIAVARKTLDAVKQQGDYVITALESAAQAAKNPAQAHPSRPDKGGALDVRA